MGKIYNENIGTFAGAWDVLISKPLDTRSLVDTYTSLKNLDTWKASDGNYYFYKGMPVITVDTGILYVYVGDPTNVEDIKKDSNWITLKEFASYRASVSIGGINEGDDLTGLSTGEILNKLFNVEYAPLWVDATAEIGGTQTYEVGLYIPAQSAFIVSGEPAKAVSGSYIASGGSATDTVTISGGSFNTLIITKRQIQVILSRTYAAGSTEVKTSKGKTTNKTSIEDKTKIADATTNSNIDATTFKIKEITKTSTATVSFAYPIWWMGTKLEISYDACNYSTNGFKCSASTPLTFEIPDTYTHVVLLYQDMVTKEWVTVATAQLAVTKTLGPEGHTITKGYKKYTFAENAGSRPYRLSFTIA